MKINIKEIVKEGYSKIAEKGCCSSGFGCDNKKSNETISKAIGYSEEEIKSFSEANLGLGCGNPVSLSNIKIGDVVLDLGSGAGFDALIARRKVGENGEVIGIDMTPEMIEKARKNAEKRGYKNVKFILGEIEKIPLKENSIDVIISNCVINLSLDKRRVFQEAKRILKEEGKMYVSDIVLLEELPKEKKENKKLICGCVAGALIKEKYLAIVKKVGFDYKILNEDKKISKEQYRGINLESIKLELIKSKKEQEKVTCCSC
jgi:arsenite methyltransferase